MIGARTHDLLIEGELIGGTLVGHAGDHATHVGVLELGEDGARCRVLVAGPLTRGTLCRACDSSANPGPIALSGEHVAALLARGSDPDFAAETPRPLRGRERGVLQTVGSADPIDPDATYRVAGTDWELGPYGGLVEAGWGAKADHERPTIVREFVGCWLNGART